MKGRPGFAERRPAARHGPHAGLRVCAARSGPAHAAFTASRRRRVGPRPPRLCLRQLRGRVGLVGSGFLLPSVQRSLLTAPRLPHGDTV